MELLQRYLETIMCSKGVSFVYKTISLAYKLWILSAHSIICGVDSTAYILVHPPAEPVVFQYVEQIISVNENPMSKG